MKPQSRISPQPRPWSEQAFTLVELLVVVVIIAVMAAFLIPALLPAPSELETVVAVSRQEPVVSQVEDPLARRPLPALRRATVKLELRPQSQRASRGDARIHYRSLYQAEFEFLPSTAEAPPRITIPLPSSTLEAQDLRLELSFAGHSTPELNPLLRVDTQAIHWLGTPPEGFESALITARLQIRTSNVGDFRLHLPPAQSTQNASIRLATFELPAARIAQDSLQPKSSTASLHTWRYGSLSTQRPVALSWPAVIHPLSRALWMLKLCGLAVLLFGVGFWYLAESYRPGALSNFHWRHFLLLTLTYSLFFAVFIVLSYESVRPWTAILLAAAVSVPLLTWHVATVIDWKFAARYTLPLTALTIGVVVNGTYGGELQSYTFLAVAAFVVAWLTFTLDDMVKQQAVRQGRLELAAETRLAKLEPLRIALRTADGRAMQMLATPDPGVLQSTRADVISQRGELAEVLAVHDRLLQRRVTMRGAEGFDRRLEREGLERGLCGSDTAMHNAVAQLSEAVDLLATRRDEFVTEHPSTALDHDHCIACGHACGGTRHCPECGTKRPLALECSACGNTTPLPLHLLDDARTPAIIHCTSCGERHDWS